MKIALIVGTRPNFVKIAPLIHALESSPCKYCLIHTGQHFDSHMNDSFFCDLQIPTPDYNLNINGGTQADQVGRTMAALDPLLKTVSPNLVLVVGDTNSSSAAAQVARSQGIKIAHVEAGLRSRDLTMPEENNRLVTDSLTDYYFISEPSGLANLQAEGKKDHLYLVGNIMIDSLVSNLTKIQSVPNISPWSNYALLTLHRISNVDSPKVFADLVKTINQVANLIPIIFPVHPRTKVRLNSFALHSDIVLVDPQGYLSFQKLMSQATLILTDSGGVQDETTYLGKPCLTLRSNTERPITVDIGTSTLVGHDRQLILKLVRQVFSGKYKKGSIPPLWDGHTSNRIVDILATLNI